MQGPILFITGAGASVDSGLYTYRGDSGIYTNLNEIPKGLTKAGWEEDPINTWDTIIPLIENINENRPGPTYQLIKRIAKRHSVYILTQNVDGYANSIIRNDHVCELHGDIRAMICETCNIIHPMNIDNIMCDCGNICKPNIVLYGENLSCTIPLPDKPYKTVIIIGTTLQFPYLNKIVDNLREHAKIVHINPDDSYHINVKKGDIWMKMTSSKALRQIVRLL